MTKDTINPKSITFQAEILQHKNMNAAYIEFPFSEEEIFGKRGHIKVKACFDGKAEYRGSLANMGTGCHILVVTQAIRKQIDKGFGQTISVEIEQDIEPRIVILPQDVQDAFIAFPEAEKIYNGMSYSNRRENMMWIEAAKKAETRERRIVKMINMLLDKHQSSKLLK